MAKFPKHLDAIEARIINRVLSCVLARGFTVTVRDEEEYSLARNTTNRALIQSETAATGITFYIMRDASQRFVGSVMFIHGNGCDVISDYHDAIRDAIQPALDLADRIASA